ncbi:MAG: DUF411 domain-containing protein [Magnetococcales bacterium]|nr:DUF411 domain-containing protein [Magnetococcales bacterium]
MNEIKVTQSAKKSGWGVIIVTALALLGASWLFFPQSTLADNVVVYKSPSCGCCDGWVKHMESNGFKVTINNVDDVYPIKSQLGVPEEAASCHTAKVGKYIVEGHVPVADIRRMLKEKPQIDGIAAPGMPMGSPGMTVPGQPADHYDIITFKDGRMGGVFSKY